jgi:acyl-CoA synthetase (AMP-forming)/AMP-acid ligase II
VFNTEITLPYKEPQLTTDLVAEIVGPECDDVLSAKVPSLRDILLIDNSSGRVDVTSLPVTADYYPLLLAYRGQRLPIQHQLQADDVVNIQFTSGTTSSPKAACLTHHNILNNGFLVGEGMQLTEQDVICCPPPLYHCFGLVLGLLAAMTHGQYS